MSGTLSSFFVLVCAIGILRVFPNFRLLFFSENSAMDGARFSVWPAIPVQYEMVPECLEDAVKVGIYSNTTTATTCITLSITRFYFDLGLNNMGIAT